MEGQKRRILVIEDEELLRNVLRKVLRPEHDVVALERAQAALGIISAGARFDLILCDLMLPGMTGMDFQERVSVIAPELVPCIVFTSGGAFTDRAAEFIKRPDIRHIEKPFPPVDGLRALVRELLANTGRSRFQ
jgi:DNA-binding NtrC family response regulator